MTLAGWRGDSPAGPNLSNVRMSWVRWLLLAWWLLLLPWGTGPLLHSAQLEGTTHLASQCPHCQPQCCHHQEASSCDCSSWTADEQVFLLAHLELAPPPTSLQVPGSPAVVVSRPAAVDFRLAPPPRPPPRSRSSRAPPPPLVPTA